MRISFASREAAGGIRRHVGATVAVIVTVSIALGMLGGALMLSAQIREMKGFWYDKTEVAVFITDKADQAAVDALGARLRSDAAVEKVYYEDQQQAYQHFSQQFRDNPALVSQVTADQLPRSYRLKLVDPKNGGELSQRFGGQFPVSRVVDEHAQLSSLFRVFDSFQIGALALALIQGGAALILITTSVRSSVAARRRELAIGRAMGASRTQLSVPFLVESATAGLLGALGATSLLFIVEWQLVQGRLKTSHVLSGVVSYIGWDAVWAVVPVVVLAGVLLPVCMAAIALRRSLR